MLNELPAADVCCSINPNDTNALQAARTSSELSLSRLSLSSCTQVGWCPQVFAALQCAYRLAPPCLLLGDSECSVHLL